MVRYDPGVPVAVRSPSPSPSSGDIAMGIKGAGSVDTWETGTLARLGMNLSSTFATHPTCHSHAAANMSRRLRMRAAANLRELFPLPLPTLALVRQLKQKATGHNCWHGHASPAYVLCWLWCVVVGADSLYLGVLLPL